MAGEENALRIKNRLRFEVEGGLSLRPNGFWANVKGARLEYRIETLPPSPNGFRVPGSLAPDLSGASVLNLDDQPRSQPLVDFGIPSPEL